MHFLDITSTIADNGDVRVLEESQIGECAVSHVESDITTATTTTRLDLSCDL